MSAIGNLQKALAVFQIRSFSFLSTRIRKGSRSSLHHFQKAAQSTVSARANSDNENANARLNQQDKASNKGPNTAKSAQAGKHETKYYSLKDYREVPEKQQSDESNTAKSTQATKRDTEYYTLKDYREGPNTESGKLDSHCDSSETKRHNLDVEDRHKNE
ncbi:hypothetical protein BDW75DRAFT_207419 [Aspergillus navahoensis]